MELEPGYRELPPPDALRDVVACVWVRVAGGPGEVRVVPDGSADVVWRRGEGVTVVGPDTSAKLVGQDADDVIVGVRLLPGAGGVLGVPLDTLRDLRVDVADVDRAFEVDPDAAPDEVVARLLAAAAQREPDPLVAEAARRLAAQDVAVVARDLWVSERQLRRRFHAAVGYGPKTLTRVLRFRRFVEAIDSGRTDLARLALDTGFSDQAHLTRETKRLSGLPPAALISARSAKDAPLLLPD